MIRFHILGAGGAVPTASHSPAAYLVTVDDTPILLDPGPGALVGYARCEDAAGDLDNLAQVLVTHLHPDHCADLVPILFALHSVVPQGTRPFVIHGPAGLIAYLAKMQEIYGNWLNPRRRELNVVELEPGRRITLPGGGDFECFAVQHPQDRLSSCALGYRFTDRDGHSAVFSGDTEACPGLEKAARNADLLVVECSTPDELATPGHMTPTSVGHLCTASRPRRVVLTHQYPAAAALDLAALVARRFDGPVHQARDGSVYTVPEDADATPGPDLPARDKETR